jgi:mRNA interferase MazF
MARVISRGEIWSYTFKAPDKRRPVVVLSRQDVIGLLHTVMVAPITSTIYGAPSEVLIGTEEGMKHESAVNLDHVQTVVQSRLGGRLGHLGPAKLREVCRALAVATGCAH